MSDIDIGSGAPSGAPPAPPSAPSVGHSPGSSSGSPGSSSGGSPGQFPGSSSAATEKRSVREHLTDGFARARQRMGLDDDDGEAQQPDKQRPRRTRAEAPDGNAQNTDANQDTGTNQQAPGYESSSAPAAWAKDAKVVWATVPPEAKAAILKREQDVEKGVAALRDHYSGIDNVLGQYDQELRSLGIPAPKVMDNLFAWMKTIHSNPVQGIPALMASYNFSPEVAQGVIKQLNQRYFPQKAAAFQAFLQQQKRGGQPQGQGQKGQAPQQPRGPDPQLVQAFQARDQRIAQLENYIQQSVGGIQNHFQQESQKQTNNYLGSWAKDKPHFEEVRHFMARLLTPDPETGQPAIPLKDGNVDLDAAYDYAIYAIPGVRQKVLAAQQAATQQAAQGRAQANSAEQARQVASAVRKNVSLTSVAPGGQPKPQIKKGLSVRESIADALAQQRKGRM